MRKRVFRSQAFLVTAALLVFLIAEPLKAANNPLTLFKNYFVTGDYGSNGVGLRGLGTLDPITGEKLAKGSINVNVPPNADIVAAFLYWQTVEKTDRPSSARGYLLDPSDPNARIKILGKPIGRETAPCWSSGGATGVPNGALSLRVYRADILRYLQISPITQKKLTNITVLLPDSGSNGNVTPMTEGASLVVVYRDQTLPFKGIVIFDGAFTMNQATDSLNQKIDGFYEASITNPNARITHIVGDGQANFSERLWFGPDASKLNLLAVNPFTGSAGQSWDNLTYNIGQFVPGDAASVYTRVDHAKDSFDCVSWSAIVFSTTVQDTDSDGLLDVWEKTGFTDMKTGTFINLPAMGANPQVKDVFVEVDYLQDLQGNNHSHLPKKDALDLVGNAFKNAPSPPNGPGQVTIHFDVGNNYQTSPPDPYIIPAALAQGGDVIDERSGATYCTAFSNTDCLFPNQPGLISWKKGLRHIQQAHVPGLTKQYFNDARSPIFHYTVFGHGLAIEDQPLPPPASGFSAKSVSGRGDLPGGDFVVTLGLWQSTGADAQVGSKILQASTMLHELAHNIGGYHGGTPTGLNCKPNHQSSLNYLYQSAGLLDKTGKATVDLSREAIIAPNGAEDEIALDEFLGLGGGNMAYRLRWYAPQASVQSRLGISVSAAKGYCDGSARVANSGVVRMDGFDLSRRPIDWNFNGSTIDHPQVDINFNGILDTTQDFAGSNDWLFITQTHGFQQLDSRRSLFGLSLGVVAEDLLQAGEADLGEADLGEADLGDADLGEADLGTPALGEADLGEADLGEADLGAAGLGEADLGEVSDIDFDTAAAIGTAPSGLTATNPARFNIVLSWDAPAVGSVKQYTVYRSTGSTIVQPLKQFGPFNAGTTSFTDMPDRINGTFTYFVVATFDDGTTSNPSNFVTILNR